MNHVPWFLLVQLPACGFRSVPPRLPEPRLRSIARITLVGRKRIWLGKARPG